MAKNKKKSSDKSEKETKKAVKDEAVESEKETKKSKKEENVVDDIKESKKDKKDKKDSDKKEPGKIGKWFKDLKIEFKKVVWPSKETVVTNTSVVVGVIALSAVLVGLLDEVFLILMRIIYNS